MEHVHLPELKAHLARLGLTQLDLARRLNRPVSTLAGWLRGAHPPPPDLREQIERALELPAGTLAPKVSEAAQ